MKRLSPLIFLLFLPALIHAQTDHCDKFNILLEKSRMLWAQKKFEDAFAKLSAAREACPSKVAEVDDQYSKYIRDIAKKYETADLKTREAKREAEKALAATELAMRNASRSDSIANAAERAARRAYANDLAYKSTIALRDGDRTAAFRLAEFAHRYVDDNVNVTKALVEAIYYNENPENKPLAWAENTLSGHSSSVNSVAFSPDGKKIATGSSDKTAKIWDLESGKNILTLSGHTNPVWSVAFSPDGKKIATGSSDNTAKIWDLESGKVILTLSGHTSFVFSVTFSPDGKKLATGALDNTAKIWDLESGKVILTLSGHSSSVYSVAFSPDGKKLATGALDKTAKIWDLESGKVILTLSGHTSFVMSVAFSPDGKKLATGSDDNTAKIWDLESGKDILTLSGHSYSVSSVAFSPDGKKIATGSYDQTAKIWDLELGKDILTISGHTSSVWSVAFSPDGKKLATGSYDYTAKIWDLDTGENILTLSGHTSFVFCVVFSPDGKKLATGSEDKTAKIWDLDTGNDILTFSGHKNYVRSVAFSPDGKKLATGSDDKTAKIWDLESGEDILMLSGHNNSVYSVAFSPDGKRLSTGSADQTAKIWDLESGKNILTLSGHSYSVLSVIFSPDGKRLSTGSADQTAKIWDLESGKDILTLSGHSNAVMSVAFSPDGKRLATGSSDQTGKIWDLDTGEDILTLSGHSNSVMSVAFSPDGIKLATGSADKTAKIWDLDTGKDILTLRGHSSSVISVAFSPAGKKIATGSYDNTAKIWELTLQGWLASPVGHHTLSGLISSQLNAYGLSGLLDIRPGNEQILRRSNDARQIAAFAELSDQNTRNSRDLRRTSHDYARAARLYGYALESGGDSSLLSSLGILYLHWAEDILASDRPDTAFWYIDRACSLYLDKSQCPKLWYEYSEKTGKKFDFQRYLLSEDATELGQYGNYFFEKGKWGEAQKLYEKSESKQHAATVLKNLFTISVKKGEAFDFNRFLVSEDAEELWNYGHFFFKDTLLWDNARLLFEKAERKQHSALVLQKLYIISEKEGKPFDFKSFIDSKDASELGQYATFFTERGDAIKQIKNAVPFYQNAVLLKEKQITIDTSAAIRFSASEVYNKLGYSQLFLPDGKAAEASLLRALELNPNNKYPRNKLATALMLQGRFKEAEAEYKKWAPMAFSEENRPTYREAFLLVLTRMEEQGVPNFDYARVREWLK